MKTIFQSYLSDLSISKRGSMLLPAVTIILALTVLGYFLVGLSLRECNSNRDCSSNAYCGSDYECHVYPDEIMVKENNFLPAALVLGVSIIVSTFILKKKNKV
ncbi:hypothetical protein J4437_00810 [Candidatus Woesearchaeota archaeon]|nr:hypothetical protein [Candidatus Woesearchaeota archaeon]